MGTANHSTKFSYIVMSDQANNTQTGVPQPPAPAVTPLCSQRPPQMMVTPQPGVTPPQMMTPQPPQMMMAPQPQYAPQRQAMGGLVTTGDDTYCGPISLIIGICIPCGCWICLCPIDRRQDTTIIMR